MRHGMARLCAALHGAHVRPAPGHQPAAVLPPFNPPPFRHAAPVPERASRSRASALARVFTRRPGRASGRIAPRAAPVAGAACRRPPTGTALPARGFVPAMT